jgi:hypothetical protein
MANIKGIALAGAAGVAVLLVKRTALRRAGTAIVVARTVWKDPRVQKVRRRVEKKIQHQIKKRAARR